MCRCCSSLAGLRRSLPVSRGAVLRLRAGSFCSLSSLMVRRSILSPGPRSRKASRGSCGSFPVAHGTDLAPWLELAAWLEEEAAAVLVFGLLAAEGVLLLLRHLAMVPRALTLPLAIPATAVPRGFASFSLAFGSIFSSRIPAAVAWFRVAGASRFLYPWTWSARSSSTTSISSMPSRPRLWWPDSTFRCRCPKSGQGVSVDEVLEARELEVLKPLRGEKLAGGPNNTPLGHRSAGARASAGLARTQTDDGGPLPVTTASRGPLPSLLINSSRDRDR